METLRRLASAFLGDYVYVPLADLAIEGEDPLPDQIFIKVPLGHDVKSVEKSLISTLQAKLGDETDFNKDLNRASVPELQKQNAQTANVIDDLILVMGLASLLITQLATLYPTHAAAKLQPVEGLKNDR